MPEEGQDGDRCKKKMDSAFFQQSRGHRLGSHPGLNDNVFYHSLLSAIFFPLEKSWWVVVGPHEAMYRTGWKEIMK